MGLPTAFCWTRVGSEAGQSLHSILQRKEDEREANGGIFYWGIGNAIGPSVRQLLQREPAPEVIFSPIKSRPRRDDEHPSAVAAWTRAECLDGTPFELPPRVLVTSRLDAASPKSSHYALVCATHTPLTTVRLPSVLDVDALENFLTGRPIGASQVTAVVRRRTRQRSTSREYEVTLRATLVAPFFLRLTDPILLPHDRDAANWESIVERVWAQVRRRRKARVPTQTRLPLQPQLGALPFE